MNDEPDNGDFVDKRKGVRYPDIYHAQINLQRYACPGVRPTPPAPLSLEVSVLVLPVGLQHHSDGGHEWLHHAELQRGLLTEAQEADGVGAAPQAARPVHAAGPGSNGTQRRDSTAVQELKPSLLCVGMSYASSLPVKPKLNVVMQG